MRLTRLRIVGFKTFVEPTEVAIQPGLTGVVGPNGCGKSNLVEALRWVMGESSHKNMRAGGMEDVIFAGSTARAARNTAEVLLGIDNADRRAPAAFNDADALEVTRRIERQHGSSYHVNGREVRARDVQLLFADAATGARSPALVRQGQVSELIQSKPQARRRILEDAAGIAGLHARRHEAELRLRHAEDNLLRVEDVLREIGAQADTLRRQGRQAARYRSLSADIRTLEAQLQAEAYRRAEAERLAAAERQRVDMRAVADATAAQAEAARAQAVAAHEIGPLRDAERTAAAALRRLAQARAELEGEERRSVERAAELERRQTEAERDAARQAQVRADAAQTVARLGTEAAELARAEDNAGTRRAELDAAAAGAMAALAEAEGELTAVEAELSQRAVHRGALERERAAERGRAERQGREAERLRRDLAALEASRTGQASDPIRARLDAAAAVAQAAEEALGSARAALAAARSDEGRERAASAEAERAAQRVETELRTLAKLFASSGKRFPTMLDAVRVTAGSEGALAAALGDDLDASPDAAAPVRWQDTGLGEGDPPLPEGAAPLAEQVEGPAALVRRLRQIGLISRGDAPRLVPLLAPGQRLVSVEGDLWRWDGYAAAADAPSAAARRLAERNRLASLEEAATGAREAAEIARRGSAGAESRVRDAAAAEAEALESSRQARRALDGLRDELARDERRETEGAARYAALAETVGRVGEAEREARDRVAEIEGLLLALPEKAGLDRRHLAARAGAADARAAAAEARAALGSFTREGEAVAKRRVALAADIRLWTDRAERAGAAASEFATRLALLVGEREALAAAPDTFIQRRRALGSETTAAEARRADAADRLSAAERSIAEADRRARTGLEALAVARERRAAADARAEAAARRVGELARAIADTFDTDPAGLLSIAGLGQDQTADPDAVEGRLAVLKGDRERLGGVNLRAEEELAETEGKQDKLAAERDDLVEAIKRLRQAVQSLNREGRERLNAAFGTVNAHFRRLFTTLFGGGEAELTLVDSDDPLEAGLEIMARPPGKKPQSLSLLSGGEQALTATALIFAVFLTNPSPICVLDEVDAPLDDANVERYCDLLRAMAGETDTRFVVITHNPITMARMDQLLGVTMAERGVSQLVSVDLEAAEKMREAS